MEISLQDQKDTSLLRAGLYSLFSRIFREEANKKLLESFKNKLEKSDFDSVLKDTAQGSAFKKGFDNLRNFFAKKEINSELLEELSSDYASLFLGAGKNPAHPYESVYASKERLIMREPWNDVRRIYKEFGLFKEKSFKQPEDHIAVELVFMVHLCLEMQNAIEKGDTEIADRLLKTQRLFLKTHLSSWVADFCDDIIQGSAKYDFYGAVAQIFREFILIEEDNL
jgi:anaerobic sulfite reductase subunit A